MLGNAWFGVRGSWGEAVVGGGFVGMSSSGRMTLSCNLQIVT